MGKHRSRKTMDKGVSNKFKTIVEHFICANKNLTYSYKPTPVEIEYLADYIIKYKNYDVSNVCLNLSKIKLTVETGSKLGKLLNGSQVNQIYIQIKGDGEMAFIEEMKQITKYNFSNSKIRLDKIESLTNSLNESLTDIDISSSNISVNGLRIILRVLKENLKESNRFSYNMRWNQSYDINKLGLDELLDCFGCHEFMVNNYPSKSSIIQIDTMFQVRLFLNIHVDYNKIKIRDIKKFLNQNKNIIWKVVVFELKPECLLLMSMIDIIKDLTIELDIFCRSGGFGQEKINKIMEGLIETNLTDLLINISDLTSDGFEIIIDKVKSMKLEKLSLNEMEMINFNYQTVIKLVEIPGLNMLSIEECELNKILINQLFCKLKHSNLTMIELVGCNINCEDAKIIAESLKNTNVSSINLNFNKIKNAGIKSIANAVGQTKLNTLSLNFNDFDEVAAIELLKSVQKTKVTSCCIYPNMNNRKEVLEAIPNVLKDNKILLQCIPRGGNEKVDEYMERNENSFNKAQLVIDKYQKGTISYYYKYKDYFEAYELFVDTDILWFNISDEKTIKLNLGNKIKDNYMKICGIVNEKLEANNKNSNKETNFSDLSIEILNKICSYINLSDVIS